MRLFTEYLESNSDRLPFNQFIILSLRLRLLWHINPREQSCIPAMSAKIFGVDQHLQFVDAFYCKLRCFVKNLLDRVRVLCIPLAV